MFRSPRQHATQEFYYGDKPESPGKEAAAAKQAAAAATELNRSQSNQERKRENNRSRRQWLRRQTKTITEVRTVAIHIFLLFFALLFSKNICVS